MSSTRHPPFLRPFQLQEGSFFAQKSKIFLAKIRVDKRNTEIWKNVDFQVLKRIIGLNRRKTPGSLKRKVINGDSTEARYCLFFRFAFLYPLSSYIHFNAKIPGCPAWNFCVRKNKTEKRSCRNHILRQLLSSGNDLFHA